MPRREGKHSAQQHHLTQVGLSHWLAVFPWHPYSPDTAASSLCKAFPIP